MAAGLMGEIATLTRIDGSVVKLERPKGSRRFFVLDSAGRPTSFYRTRRWLKERPQMDRRCASVTFGDRESK
jgi:hypothetical protein